MDCKVVITIDAERDLERHIRYLWEEKRSEQSAGNVLEDFEQTKMFFQKLPVAYNYVRIQD